MDLITEIALICALIALIALLVFIQRDKFGSYVGDSNSDALEEKHDD